MSSKSPHIAGSEYCALWLFT